jgi:hypothetical protein
MRYITMQALRGDQAEIRRKLSKDRDLIVTLRGKPIAILTAVSEEDLDASLAAIRRARGLAAMKSMHETSRRLGTNRMSMKEIDAEIATARRARRR